MNEPKPLTKRERAWVERLRKTLAAQPPGLYLFGTGPDIAVLRDGDPAYDADTRRDEVLATVDVPNMDCGDW